jgi:hypothetical protein
VTAFAHCARTAYERPAGACAQLPSLCARGAVSVLLVNPTNRTARVQLSLQGSAIAAAVPRAEFRLSAAGEITAPSVLLNGQPLELTDGPGPGTHSPDPPTHGPSPGTRGPDPPTHGTPAHHRAHDHTRASGRGSSSATTSRSSTSTSTSSGSTSRLGWSHDARSAASGGRPEGEHRYPPLAPLLVTCGAVDVLSVAPLSINIFVMPARAGSDCYTAPRAGADDGQHWSGEDRNARGATPPFPPSMK